MNFGSYELHALLGRGAAGEVWRAYDPRTGRTVALRLLPPGLSDDAVSQLVTQLRIAAALNDPHLVPIHDFGQRDGRLFVEMRFIEGRTLTSVLATGAMPPSAVASLVDQVASALRTAHRAGLVHGGVRPSNIMVTDDGFAYLADLGVSLAEMSAPAAWPYLAPERFGDAKAGPASDVYSLTSLSFECLTGTTPFPGTTLQSLAVAHMSTPPPRPSRYPGVPAAFDDVIAHGMAKEPDRRFASAMEFAVAARAAIERIPPATRSASSPGPSARRRRNVVVAATGTAMAVVLCVAVGVVVARPTDSTESAARPTPNPVLSPPVPREPEPTVYGSQVVLPFAGLDGPTGVAVAADGDLVVADMNNERVVQLAASGVQTTLPFAGLTQPVDVAVDAAGNVFVADFGDSEVFRWQPDTGVQSQVPLVDIVHNGSVAVDGEGNVYAEGFEFFDMVMVPGGTGAQEVVPLDRVNIGNFDVAVTGDIYVVDLSAARVMHLDADWTTQTMVPFPGIVPYDVAVGADGSVYVTDITNPAVAKWTPGADAAVTLPFSGLTSPSGVAVDDTGNVYVTDGGLNQVVMLPVV